MNKFVKATGRQAFIGTMAADGENRELEYLRNGGCNVYESGSPKSTPLGFWNEQDILQYIRDNNLPYAKCYGRICKRGGKLITTGVNRTGCMFCMFGVHLEPEPNRFQRMQITHPDRWAYCTGGGQMVNGKWVPSNKGLGIGFILDYIGVPWKNDEGLWPMKELIEM